LSSFSSANSPAGALAVNKTANRVTNAPKQKIPLGLQFSPFLLVSYFFQPPVSRIPLFLGGRFLVCALPVPTPYSPKRVAGMSSLWPIFCIRIWPACYNVNEQL
jgi:hypothetical protein